MKINGLLISLQVIATICLCCVSSAVPVLWAVTGVGDCNATCGPAARSLKFGCYATNNNGLLVRLPQTSPQMFVARSTIGDDGRLPDGECTGVPLPITRTVECQLPDCTEAPQSKVATPGYRWQWKFDDVEIKCSARCNHVGTLSLPIECVDSTGAVAKSHFCEQAEGLQSRPDLALPCYKFDGCTPVWKAGPWSSCSRPCGLGEIDRKVDCYQLVDSASGPHYQLKTGQCSHSEEKPHLREYCVLNRTCQPYYRIRPEKCMLQFSASVSDQRLCNETGLVRNSPQCVQLTSDLRARSNVTVPVQQSLCRSLGLSRPPPFSKCQVDKETLQQRGVKCINPSVARQPEFSPVRSVLVQMERRESLQVNCGQSATVIPGTRLRLHCKVSNYKENELKWRRQGSEADLPSQGCKRLCVVDGDLVIAKFRPKDSGVYEVIADSQNASLSLHSHSAYDAYVKAYLPRMMLLQPNSKARQQAKSIQLDTPNRETLLWMSGPWSACSVPCGGIGYRSRTVHCEQLQSSAYAIVSEAVCESQLGVGPNTTEPCGSHSCPVWRVGKWDDECSVRHCYSPGYSLLTRQVQCVNQDNQNLPDSQCGHNKKPESVHTCRNQLCQPEWDTGQWSPCSVSCGAYGFSSRQIRCVWQPNGRPAGFACERATLEVPRSFKSCYTGACELLGCVDLSPVCSIYQASALCAHSSLRRNCCKTCNAYQLHVYRSLATRVVSSTAA